MPSKCKTSPSRLLAAQRRQKALKLRFEGYSFSEISEEIGISRQRVGKIVREELDRYVSGAEKLTKDMVDSELTKLVILEDAAWGAAMAGDVSSIMTIVKIMERRAKLLGLDKKRNSNTGDQEPFETQTQARYVVMTVPLNVTEEEWNEYQDRIRKYGNDGSGEVPEIG